MNIQNSTRGQTLFELVIALGVGTLIVTSIVALVTASLRNSNFAKNKTEANKYTQEALEWLRSEKERDWAGFWARSANPSFWCLVTPSWPGSQGQCSGSQYITGTSFIRQVNLDQDQIDTDGNGTKDTDIVITTVTVSWDEGGRTHKSEATTQLGNTN